MDMNAGIEMTMSFAVEHLGLMDFDGSVEIVFDDLSAEEANGIVIREGNIFKIFLHAGREVGATMMTLLHEMVHVKQFVFDNLAEAFDETIPYFERWWEIEADAMSKAMAVEMIK